MKRTVRFAFVLPLLLLAVPAHAAIAFVQAASNTATGSASSVTATFSGNNTAGCLLVITASNYASSPSLGTPTDTAGDTGHFLEIDEVTYENPGFTIIKSWEVTSCAGGANAITITGAADSLSIAVAEYSYSGTIVLDQHQQWLCGNTSTSSVGNVYQSPPVSPSTANEMAIAWVVDTAANVNNSVNNSYTKRTEAQGSRAGTIALADRSVSSLGTYATVFTGGTSSAFGGGAFTFCEGCSVKVPPIEQLGCGQALEPWHELGTFTTNDVQLTKEVSGDCIIVGYRVRSDTSTPPTISNLNGFSWTAISAGANYGFWSAPVTGNFDYDIISFGNVFYANSSKVIELHGGASCPAASKIVNSGSTDLASWTLGGYTTPSGYYCTSSVACNTPSQWYGVMFDTRALLGDFLILAESDGGWADTTVGGSIPGTKGIDLFPTQFANTEMWLPGAPPANVRHKAVVY